MSESIVQILRTREFERTARKLWDVGELGPLIENLAVRAGAGAHLGAGLYKIRVPASGRGKRGGARMIYLWLKERQTIYLLAAYAKNEKSDLTPAELKRLRKFALSLRGER